MVNTGHAGACLDCSDLIGWEGNEWCTPFPEYFCQRGMKAEILGTSVPWAGMGWAAW